MKSVVICGSRRFDTEAKAFAASLKKAGVTVFEPYFHRGERLGWDKLSDDYKKFTALGLTHDHFYKIKMADVVFVYNKGGYAGVSTTVELGYAVAMGKAIYAMETDSELCRHVLIRDFAKTPAALVKKLK